MYCNISHVTSILGGLIDSKTMCIAKCLIKQSIDYCEPLVPCVWYCTWADRIGFHILRRVNIVTLHTSRVEISYIVSYAMWYYDNISQRD